MKFWKLMASYDAEGTTYSVPATTLGGPTQPFMPDFNGKLIALRTVASQGAATSLLEHGNFRLNCTAWKPNTMEVGFQGTGLETAPAMGGGGDHLDWPVEQPVQSGVAITIEGRHDTAATPVTAEVFLYGLFEV